MKFKPGDVIVPKDFPKEDHRDINLIESVGPEGYSLRLIFDGDYPEETGLDCGVFSLESIEQDYKLFPSKNNRTPVNMDNARLREQTRILVKNMIESFKLRIKMVKG